MPELIVVLAVLAVLALLTIARQLVGIHFQLRRIEEDLREQTDAASRIRKGQKAESMATAARAGAFEKFMTERPDLQAEPKSAQFAAFRKWRKEQGLNWDKS